MKESFKNVKQIKKGPKIPIFVTEFDDVFNGASNLESVEFLGNPENITISADAFANTPLLKEVTVPGSKFYSWRDKLIGKGIPKVFIKAQGTITEREPVAEAITFARFTEEVALLPYSEVPYKFNITDLTVANCAGSSGTPAANTLRDALYNITPGCYVDLSETVLPDNVTDMSNTFYGCTSLTTAPNIPSGVTNMSGTFYGCTSLTMAPNIPDNVTNMSGTFISCTSLTTAPTMPSVVTSMNSTFNGCTSLTTAPTIPSGVTDMNSTFNGCTSLTTAPTIPSSVTSMGSTFYGCTSLTTAPVIPNSITDMNNTFYGCASLTMAPVIPNSITNMGSTFYGCTSLKEITAWNIEDPTRVTSKSLCFYNCRSLKTIRVPFGKRDTYLITFASDWWIPDTTKVPWIVREQPET